MGIQSYFIEKKVRQSLQSTPKNNVEHHLNRINKVALIVDEKSGFNVKHFNALKDQLKLNETAISILTIKTKCPKDTEPEDFTFCVNKVNWFGRVKSDSYHSFIANDYDLMIDYVSSTSKYIQLIISSIKAPLKVGFAQNNSYFYNIILNIKPDNIEAFHKELIRYLNILKLL